MLQFLKTSSYCISHDYILNQKDNGVTEAKTNSAISDDVLSDAPYIELWSTLRNHPRAIIFNGDEDVSKKHDQELTSSPLESCPLTSLHSNFMLLMYINVECTVEIVI